MSEPVMMEIRFSTKAAAIAAGWEQLCNPCAIHNYRGFYLFSADVSGPGAYGYDYALQIGWDFLSDKWLNSPRPDDSICSANLARAHDLEFTEQRNRLGRLGCFSTGWYTAEEIRNAREKMERLVDDYYAKHPEAVFLGRDADARKSTRPNAMQHA